MPYIAKYTVSLGFLYLELQLNLQPQNHKNDHLTCLNLSSTEKIN
jgi:hypothetical protein